MATLRQQLLDLIDKLSPDVEQAFLEAIADIRSEIVLREIVEKLERQDVEGAINALHIEQSAFRPLTEALRIAFNQGGVLTIGNIPRLSDPLGGRVVLRWDVSNQRAEAIIRDLSSKLITDVTDQTKQAAREMIAARYAEGQGPRAIALDLVGRQDKITKQRTGGVIGLNRPQAELMERTRIHLMSGDPKLMRKYLDLKTRDKRFDTAVRKAIAAGKPLDAVILDKVMTTLRNRNLRLRGETISRSETLSSVMSAKHEAYQQGLDSSGRDESLVTRKWRSSGRDNVRHTHQILNGQVVVGMTLAFQSVSGARLRYAGDRSLGAPASETIACNCDVEYNYDFAESYARARGR